MKKEKIEIIKNNQRDLKNHNNKKIPKSHLFKEGELYL